MFLIIKSVRQRTREKQNKHYDRDTKFESAVIPSKQRESSISNSNDHEHGSLGKSGTGSFADSS